MNNNSKSRSRFTHLYNPKEEGLGLYDIHYINAYKRDKKLIRDHKNENNERFAA